MSQVLERLEITPFLSIRKDKPPEQYAEELASHSLETHTVPDPYYYLVNDCGELWSSTAQCRVKDVVQRTHPVGELEYQALTATEQWANRFDEGVVVWVSPPYPGIYPVSKIIVSEIEHYGHAKRLFNRAIILDFNDRECLKFAQDLSSYSQNRPLLTYLDEVRATPLILNTHGISWTYILGELIDDPPLWQGIREGKDKKAKEEALYQARILYQNLVDKNISPQEARMRVLGMLGSGSGSCPILMTGTAFQIFSSNSLKLGTSISVESDQYGSLEFECPKCNKTNRRAKGELLPNCQHCSADVTC